MNGTEQETQLLPTPSETKDTKIEEKVEEVNIDAMNDSTNGVSAEAFDQVKEMQMQLATQMQEMQDMFLSKFKKLKQNNKILFKKAVESHV